MTFRASLVTAEQVDAETEDGLRILVGQLPIAFALRAGGEVRLTKSEIDATGDYVAELRVEGNHFIFSARKKS
jgi:hypothetical protein